MVRLSDAPAAGTSPAVEPPEIFDRQLRRRRRDRAAPDFAQYSFVRDAIVEALLDRLDLVKRSFAHALDLGTADGSLTRALEARGVRVTAIDAGARFAGDGVQGDEDRLPFPPESFDLIVSAGVLDSVNDLPGALTLIRRALRPDGLFLAAFTGAGTLSTLRGVLREAEADRPAARIHPQIDVRSAGDLLVRAGFALPVADVDSLTVRYGALGRLLGDLRGMAATNLLIGRTPLRRDTLARAATLFADRADPDGRTAERFEIVFLTGWAPAPSQPQPARRGSATASLTEALKRAGGSEAE